MEKEQTMSDSTVSDVREHIRTPNTWLRGLFMLLFAVIWGISAWVLAAVAIFQFLSVLFSGKANPNLLRFGDSLSRFFGQIVRFLTFVTDDKPFPFAEWPAGSPAEHTPVPREDG
jgi:hypothetical protein